MYQHLHSSWPNLRLKSAPGIARDIGLTNLDSEPDSRRTHHCQEQTARDLAKRARSVLVGACS
jgi:hypothetical protein